MTTMLLNSLIPIYVTVAFVKKSLSGDLGKCSQLLCEYQACPETMCECNDYSSGVSLRRLNITCPRLRTVQIKFNIKAKDFRVSCTSHPYHPQEVMKQIIPLFEHEEVKKLRMCLFDDNLSFPVTSDETPEVLRILQNVKELEISIQHGEIKEELMQYLSPLLPSLRILIITNTVIAAPQDNVLKLFPRSSSVCLHGTNLNNITAESFREMKDLVFLNISTNAIRTLPGDLLWELVNLKTIDFSKNELEILPEDIFRDCTQVQNLQLHHNALTVLSAKLFKNMKNLKQLHLHDNQLTTLHEELLTSVRKLEILDVSRNSLQNIPDKTFLFNSELQNLILSHNKFTNISAAFRSISKETFVNLDNNEIKVLYIPLTLTFNQTKKISLNNNCLKIIVNDTFVSDESKYTGKQKNDMALIKELHMENCCLTNIPRFLAVNVQLVLNLGYNELETLDNTQITYCAHLKELDLRNNKISKIDLDWDYPLTRHQVYPNAITKININNNPITCDCKLLTLAQFIRNAGWANLTNLKFLPDNLICHQPSDLKNWPLREIVRVPLSCDFPDCPNHCQCSFIQSLDVINVNCSSRNLHEFPETFPSSSRFLWLNFGNNHLSAFPVWNSTFWARIEILLLHNNDISSISNFLLTPQLKNMTLHGNRLSELEPELSNILSKDQKVTLTLSDNNWICTCQIITFKHLVFSSGKVKDQSLLQCNKSNQLQDIANITSENVCGRINANKNDLLISLCVSATLCVFVFVSVRQYKTEIRLFLFTRGWLLSCVTEDSIDTDKEYDAFISYSSENEDWVLKTLVPELEDGVPSYKLCVHTRDWPGGEWILDQIEKSVASSRRTLIVFSKEFVQSCWSRMEFHAAYRQSEEDKINRLIIILLGEIPPMENLDSEMRMYLKLNTYIKWGETHFWRKLKCAMPRRKRNRDEEENEEGESTI